MQLMLHQLGVSLESARHGPHSYLGAAGPCRDPLGPLQISRRPNAQRPELVRLTAHVMVGKKKSFWHKQKRVSIATEAAFLKSHKLSPMPKH